MGRRGPKPKPSKVLSLRAARARATAVADDSACPSWVSGPAREHWAAVAEILRRMGVMATADEACVGLLAEALGQYIDARDRYESASKKDKWVWRQARHQAWDRALKALRELGMTPASRRELKRGSGGNGSSEIRDPLAAFVATKRSG